MPEYKFLRTTRFQPDQPPMTFVRYCDLARDPAEKNPIKDPSNTQLIAGHRRFEDAMDEVRQRWIDEERTPDHEHRTRPPETFEAELLVQRRRPGRSDLLDLSASGQYPFRPGHLEKSWLSRRPCRTRPEVAGRNPGRS